MLNPERAADKKGQPKPFYGYIVTAAGLGTFLIGVGTQSSIFGVFFKPMLTEFSWTRAETALAFTLLLIVQAILAVTMGWLTDRFGPRVVVTIFGSFLGICYLLMSQINTIWQFQLNYALVGGIGMSALVVPVMATVARWFVKRRGLMTGIVQTGTGIGGVIFAPLAGWLILTYGWRSSYIVLGIIVLVGIITSGLFLRRDPKDIGQLPDGMSEVAASGVNQQSASTQEAGLPFLEAIRTSQFWMIAGLYFSFGFNRSAFLTHIAAHVQDLGFSLAAGANVLAACTGASIIGRIGMGRVADTIGNRKVLIIGFAATTAVLIWGLVTRDLWGLFLFALVFGFGWGTQAVTRFAITSESFGLASLGVMMGVLTLAEAVAAGFGSYFGGYIFDAVNSYQPIFFMGIALSIIAILLSWLLKPVVKRESTRSQIT
ncbi:L-lactate transporter [subsurface metagenome]